MAKKTVLVAIGASGPVFMATTNPGTLPLPLLVVPFVWLFVVLFLLIAALAKRRGYAQRQVSLIAGICAALPVLLLIFQSIHQLTFRDIAIALALVLVAAFYIRRADFIR